jgi:hypothetical protein
VAGGHPVCLAASRPVGRFSHIAQGWKRAGGVWLHRSAPPPRAPLASISRPSGENFKSETELITSLKKDERAPPPASSKTLHCPSQSARARMSANRIAPFDDE